MGAFRCEIRVVEQLRNGGQVLKWCVVQITLGVKRDDTVFSYKTYLMLSLKPTVGDFIVLVISHLNEAGRKQKLPEADWASGSWTWCLCVREFRSWNYLSFIWSCSVLRVRSSR